MSSQLSKSFSAPSQVVAEEERIRREYQRRSALALDSRYSFFNRGHLRIIQEVERCFLEGLSRNGFSNLRDTRILEIGCGNGFWLRELISWGARPGNLAGIDILEDRIHEARDLAPHDLELRCCSAAETGYSNNHFDLIIQSTVFTSILNAEVRRQIAWEMLRVLRSGGSVFWYDFRISNPRNSGVRGIGKAEIRDLFPGCPIKYRSLTVLPPLTRSLFNKLPSFYGPISRLKLLNTHYIAWIKKP